MRNYISVAQMQLSERNTITLAELSERSRQVLRHIIEAYCETGEPVGSRTVSRRLGIALSPASIRNVMSDLEEAGLLYAPHTSAGRLPTDQGLRLFVNGLLEVGNLTREERTSIDAQCAAAGRSLPEVLEEATQMLSGLSRCAGLVVAPKTERPLKHIEFVHLGPGRALVVLVTEDGLVENRIIELPIGLPASSLVEATNYLTARMVGRTLGDVQAEIKRELQQHQMELDELTKKVVEAGLATWAGGAKGSALIVRGQANLLEDVTAIGDLERIRALFAALEGKESLAKLVESADHADGVQIFIGSDSEQFNVAGCSMVIAPYRNSHQKIVGAVGVIGPSRLNYARIIPMVDYTAQVIGRVIG